jgi:hypothetical protein
MTRKYHLSLNLLWSENVKAKDRSEDLSIDGKNIRMDLRQGGKVWIVFFLLKIGTSGRFLSI